MVNGKGDKQRYTLLSTRLLNELRHYYRKSRPRKTYLFPTSFTKKKKQTLSYESIRSIYEKARKKAVLKRDPAFIRFATALQRIYYSGCQNNVPFQQ